MKKILALIFIIAMTFALVSCSSGEDKETADKKEYTEVNETEAYSGDSYFNYRTAETEDVKIEITEIVTLPVGIEGNEHGEKDIIAFRYNITNKSGREVTALTGWKTVFRIYQVKKKPLNSTAAPEKKFADIQNKKIKKGETVECVQAFQLNDSDTPILIKAVEKADGYKLIGSRVI